MRLLEAILDANQRRLNGDKVAVVSPEVTGSLPLAALTCIDARLNRLLPDMLGIAEDHFIWLRNAGNIITGPLSSTTRSLALGCAVKGAKEIAVIGHSDCQVCKTTVTQLLERMSALGVDRHKLPENLVEYFGLFGSERQNVMRAVEIVRSSPLIGSKVPVHGLLIDISTGKLESVVSGYETQAAVIPGKTGEMFAKAEQTLDAFARIGNAAAEELKLPSDKIGEIASLAQEWLRKTEKVASAVAGKIETAGKIVTPEPTAAKPPPVPTNPLAALQERTRQYNASRPTRPAGKKR
jgi:carbonic anhydrase